MYHTCNGKRTVHLKKASQRTPYNCNTSNIIPSQFVKICNVEGKLLLSITLQFVYFLPNWKIQYMELIMSFLFLVINARLKVFLMRSD